MLTRKRQLEILAEELERAEGLPPGANKLVAELREGVNIGPGFEATLRAMVRAEAEGKAQ
jgi:hypothetical protein